MQINEARVSINLWAQFNMNVNDTLQIRFTDPQGNVISPLVTATLNASEVVVPDDVIDEETGLPMVNFPADESVSYITSAGEFDIAGTWLAEVIYTNGTTILKTAPLLICVGE